MAVEKIIMLQVSLCCGSDSNNNASMIIFILTNINTCRVICVMRVTVAVILAGLFVL
jgi:hypothetical protein